jgi:hypothetical protein
MEEAGQATMEVKVDLEAGRLATVEVDLEAGGEEVKAEADMRASFLRLGRITAIWPVTLWLTGLVVLGVTSAEYGQPLYTYLCVSSAGIAFFMPETILDTIEPFACGSFLRGSQCRRGLYRAVITLNIGWWVYGNVIFWRTAPGTVSTTLYKYIFATLVVNYMLIGLALALFCSINYSLHKYRRNDMARRAAALELL